MCSPKVIKTVEVFNKLGNEGEGISLPEEQDDK